MDDTKIKRRLSIQSESIITWHRHCVFECLGVRHGSGSLCRNTLVKHLHVMLGEIVTSYSTNDAPALYESQIGLAMDITVTKKKTWESRSYPHIRVICHIFKEGR